MAKRVSKARKVARKSDLELWCDGVLSGDIVSGRKIKQLASRLKRDIGAKGGRWVFDRAKAERPVQFIERFCYIPSGKIGQPFAMELYEKAIVEAIFGFVDRETGFRRYNEALVIVARKNGKSSLAAAIEWYMLMADHEGAPQIYNVATAGNQAELCYKACQRMRNQSKALKARSRKRAGDLYNPRNMGYITPISSTADTKDGFDVYLAVLDEIHAMKTRALYDVMKQGMAARDQPLMFQITTAGFIRNSIYDSQYSYAAKWLDGKVNDDRFIAFVWELDDPAEWDDEAAWPKANPGLGTVKKKEFLRAQVNKAKQDPSYKPTVLTKDFNVPQNQAAAWLTFDEAVNKQPWKLEPKAFRYCVAGFDYSETTDLTAACALMMREGDDHIYSEHMYWLPEDTIAEYADQGRDRDAVPYRMWIERGLLRTVPGNKMTNRVLLEWLEELKSRYDLWTYAIGFDRWHMDDATRESFEQYVGKSRSVAVIQGPQTLSMPMKQLRADYRANRIVDGHHPINEWCRMNVQVLTDTNGNIKPVKRGLTASNRIDGFMAELDAYVVLTNNMDEYLTYI